MCKGVYSMIDNFPVRKEIAPGVTLYVINTDKFKTDGLMLTMLCPLDEIKASEYTLLSAIMQRGSRDYPETITLNRALDNLYGATLGAACTKSGSIQQVSFVSFNLCGDFTPDKTDVLDGTIKTMASIITNPLIENSSFREDYFETERTNIINSIEARINNKRAYARERLFEEMFEGEKCAISEIGDIETLKKLTPQSLVPVYYDMLKYGRYEIYYVGRENPDKLADKIKSLYSSIDRSGFKPYPLETKIKGIRSEVKYVTEEQPVQQGKLEMGFTTQTTMGDKTLPATVVFNEIYGGSPTSRLFTNVREKLNLCYYCSSRLDGTTGSMFVSSGIKNQNEEKAREEILLRLDEIKKGNITKDDIDSTIISLKNSYRSVMDNISSLIAWYMIRNQFGVEESPVDRIKTLDSITKDMIVEAANKVNLDTVYFMKGGLDNNE